RQCCVAAAPADISNDAFHWREDQERVGRRRSLAVSDRPGAVLRGFCQSCARLPQRATLPDPESGSGQKEPSFNFVRRTPPARQQAKRSIVREQDSLPARCCLSLKCPSLRTAKPCCALERRVETFGDLPGG